MAQPMSVNTKIIGLNDAHIHMHKKQMVQELFWELQYF